MSRRRLTVPLHRLHEGHPFDAWANLQVHFDPEELDSSGAPTGIRRLVFVCVVVMAALVSVDLTIVNVALPSILTDLGGGIETVQWVASIYALTYAIFLIPAGRLGDVIGHRKVFVAGGVAYTAASLLAAVAPTAFVLIAARGLQGVGAALVSPAVIALTALVFPPDRRNVAFGISAGALAVAAGFGPLIGGALTDALGWRWVFGLGALLAPLPILGMSIVPSSLDRPTTHKLDSDLGGIALLALGVGAIQVGLIESDRLGWWPEAAIAFVVAVVAGLLLVRHDRGRDDALVDVRLFRSRMMTGSLLAKFLSSFGYFGMLVYVVLFLEGTMGLTPLQVGYVLLLPALVGVATSPIVGKVLTPERTRPIIVAGVLLMASGILILAALESTSSPGLHVMPGLFLNALGFSMVSVPTKVAPLNDLPAELYGRAAALVGTVGKLAAGFGVAVSAAIFHAYSASQADQALDASDLRPPLTVDDVQSCLGVSDLEICVRGLAEQSPQIAGIQAETMGAIVTTFEHTLNSTLVTMGVSSLVGTVVVWRLLRPH